MEQFRKWIKKKELGIYIDDPHDCAEAERKYAQSWKAAFENIQQWIMGRRCTGNDALDYINEELENK